MGEDKKRGFIDTIKDSLDYISKKKEVLDYVGNIILKNMSLPIKEGMEGAMQNLDNRLLEIEKRLTRKMFSFIIIVLGVMFLVFALFFYLRDYLGWSNIVSYSFIGILMVVIFLLLKVGKLDK